VSLAISEGANVKVVQRLLGHTTAAMTLDGYGHLLSDDPSGVADALGKAIESTAVFRAEEDRQGELRMGIYLRRPHSPIGRGSGLKSDSLGVCWSWLDLA